MRRYRFPRHTGIFFTRSGFIPAFSAYSCTLTLHVPSDIFLRTFGEEMTMGLPEVRSQAADHDLENSPNICLADRRLPWTSAEDCWASFRALGLEIVFFFFWDAANKMATCKLVPSRSICFCRWLVPIGCVALLSPAIKTTDLLEDMMADA